jgi:exodeoxyribonuclease VII large subunit
MAADGEGQRRSIPQTNALVRALIEQETLDHPFWISGIVSRFYLSHLGHMYFDLVDDNYSISCMVREKLRGTLNFTITNSLEIDVYGTLRVFENKARIEIEVEKARLIERPAFVMDATVQQQLAQKGLWPKTKRLLPKNIRKIGLVTSKQSDALHDFEDVFRSENGQSAIKVADVRLQGQQAPGEIAEAIKRFNQDQAVDVIAIVRGGGRASELVVFDDLLIAEAICRSTIPVVTGIGHQRDNSLADQVADVALITPSIAASHLAKASQPKGETPTPAPGNRRWDYVIGAAIVLAAIMIAAALLYRPM